MDASSRNNTPSRKSRFGSQRVPQRPASPNSPPAEEALSDTLRPEDEQDIHSADAREPVSETEAAEDYPDEPLDPAAAEFPPATEIPPGTPAVGHVPAEPAAAQPPDDHLPAGLRLTRTAADLFDSRPRGMSGGMVTLLSLLGLVLGGVGGYFLGASHPAGNVPPGAGASTPADHAVVSQLSAATVGEVDAAFNATKQGKFVDARQLFEALYTKHPEWPSMEVEVARAALYQHDYDNAQKILAKLSAKVPNADAEFLLGLLHMTVQEQDKAQASFGRAVALDPARPDFYYFWGECLRREGKPGEAADKFRSALTRNQYETAEGLFQLKLWLSEIQADQESNKESTAKIDADLASARPSGGALFAAAARALKAGKYPEAGNFITKAKEVTDPAVFRVILQDPTFVQENYRPEIAGFYKPGA